SMEMQLFRTFLLGSPKLIAYRTEWAIFGERERLAGTIDFVTRNDRGELVLYDWKRTKQLRHKYANVFNSMTGFLSHLPSCAGFTYRLQLNCYKYLLETYYGCRVAGMYVVGLHPDNWPQPFVDEVPSMPQETHALMAFQRSLAMDACGGSNAQDELDNVSRVNKRCRVWLRLLSDHAQLSSALPMTCLALPNPLDSKLNKRPWERKMRDARMLLRMLSEGDTEALYRFYHARFPQTIANHEWLPIMLPDARQTLRQSLEDWQTEVLRVWILSLLLDADDDKLRDDVCGGCEQELAASHFDLVMHILATSDACISPTANHVDQLIRFHQRVAVHISLLREWPHLVWLLPSPLDTYASASSFNARLSETLMLFELLENGHFKSFALVCYTLYHNELAQEDWLQHYLDAAQEFPRWQDQANTQDTFRQELSQEMQSRLEGVEASPISVKRERLDPQGAAASSSQHAGAPHETKKEEPEEDDDGAPAEPEISVDTATWSVLQKRRLLPGAARLHGVPDTIVRLCVAALAVFRVRIVDVFMREHAFLLWIMQGNKQLRFHAGDCYLLHHSGAWQQYKGVPPDCGLVQEFLMQLEGIFRRMPRTVARSPEDITKTIFEMWNSDNSEDKDFLERCVDACLGADVSRRRGHAGQDEEEENGNASKAWPLDVAKVLVQIKRDLSRELQHEKLFNYMIEWCDTSKEPDGPAVQVTRAELENCYLRVPHCIKGTIPTYIMQRLQKFYQETFWGNLEVFRCNQAAQALCRRGLNVVRLFIGLSSGGVGQSLYSAHLQSMYAHNFAYFDPNIWWNEDEMRKQVEQLNGCCILTGQKTPGTNRRLREDLFKKFMSGEGISGRKPYGFRTRMIRCVGWKRLEANRMFAFSDVTKRDFNDISKDGIFTKDPTLKDFLMSGPAIAAGLQMQHAFEATHREQDCRDIIENYAHWGKDHGLTEDTMREACGLAPRDKREMSSRAAAVISVEAEAEDLTGVDVWEKMHEWLVKHCLDSARFDFSTKMFNRMRIPDAPNMNKVLLDVYIAAIKGTKRAGARAVKKDNPGEVYEERASKIEAHEKMCETVLDMQLQSAEAAPPDCKRRKRSKGQEASSQAGEPSQVASAGNRRKVDVQYYYTLPDTIRTRQQCWSLFHRFLSNVELLCTDALLIEMQCVVRDLVKNEFVQKLQRVSIYCRWLAIGLLHQEYEYFLSKPDGLVHIVDVARCWDVSFEDFCSCVLAGIDSITVVYFRMWLQICPIMSKLMIMPATVKINAHRPARVKAHLRRYHKKHNQFVASGTKQIRILMCLHDSDQLLGRMRQRFVWCCTRVDHAWNALMQSEESTFEERATFFTPMTLQKSYTEKCC
ncbi:unnamed protein product, partial [Effrenium voratum]